MYNNVKLILDTSKEREVSVLTAKDMLVAENREQAEEIKAAYECISANYDAITKCRVAGDEATIEKICVLYSNGDTDALKELFAELFEE